MRSDLACLPCAIVQALRASALATEDPSLFEDASRSVLEMAEGFDMDKSPAANATLLVQAGCRAVGSVDPYRAIKREQNRAALALEDRARRAVEASPDRVLTALLVSCLGNVIDLGAQDSFDLEKEFAALSRLRFARSDLEYFVELLSRCRRFLLIADNCGEIVFDKVLLSSLPPGIDVTVAVKSGPILNDATVEDALMTGVDRSARIVATGGSDLGVDISACSPDFRKELEGADLVIAKGHANFETLNEERMGIFFLLKAKCEVVARELGVETGSLVFVRH